MQDGKVNREGDEHPSQSSLPGEGPNTISPSMKEKFAELSGEDTTVVTPDDRYYIVCGNSLFFNNQQGSAGKIPYVRREEDA